MNVRDLINEKDVSGTATKKISGNKIEIKSRVDVDTFANIVDIISASCFKDGSYRAWNREIAKRFVILKYMTNIEVTEEEINYIFEATQVGDWYASIENEVVKLPVWSEVEIAIDNQISYILSGQKTSFDILCDTLSNMASQDLDDRLVDVKEILDKINKVDKEGFVNATINQIKNKTD